MEGGPPQEHLQWGGRGHLPRVAWGVAAWPEAFLGAGLLGAALAEGTIRAVGCLKREEKEPQFRQCGKQETQALQLKRQLARRRNAPPDTHTHTQGAPQSEPANGPVPIRQPQPVSPPGHRGRTDGY